MTTAPASWRTGRALLLGALLVSIVASAISLPVAAAASPTPTAAPASPTSPGAAAPPLVITGTVERLSVEGHSGSTDATESGRPDRADGIATFVHTAFGRVQVPTSSVRRVPTGTTVRVVLGGYHAARSTDPGDVAEAGAPVLNTRTVQARSVRRVKPAKKPVARPAVIALGPNVHSVTLVMALPPGSRQDSTTLAALTSSINGGVSQFWATQTGGRVSFTVTKAVNWLAAGTNCSDGWGLWDEIAARVGFVAGARRHLVVYLPTGANCFAGLGTIGQSINSGGNAYVRGTLTGLIAHELGHNLGLGHSNGLQCDTTSDGSYATATGWSSGCARQDYRDWYDVMGISWDNVGSLSTAQAARLGVLPGAAVYTATAPTTIALTAVSQHRGLQSLHIADPAGGSYFVEYRPASGADSWLATAANWRGLVGGVLVRRVDPVDPEQTLLLDGSPSATAGQGSDWNAALPIGASLRTASGRVTIRVDAQSPDRARVSVAFDGVWAG